MTRDDIIFTAGFLLGEGYASVRLDKRGSFIGVVSASQLDREPLERLQHLWGGSIEVFKTDRKPNVWVWQRNSKLALPCLKAILPITRDWSAYDAERIEKYIEFYATPSANRRRRLWIVAWFQTCVENHKKACHAKLEKAQLLKEEGKE